MKQTRAEPYQAARPKARACSSYSPPVVLAIVAVAGCGSSASSGSGASSSATAAIKMGGTLKVGAVAGNGNFDPVLFAGATGDIQLQSQIYEKLVTLAQDYSVVPGLATKWSTTDGKVWTFDLRPNVTFSNGQPFTSADVIYTMGRLRAKKLSPMADIYANVKSVTAPDPTTVVFTLSRVDSEFPAALTDYRDLMLCKSVAEPGQEPGRHRTVHAQVALGRRPRRPREEPALLGQGRPGQPAAVPRRGRLHLLA